MEYSLFLEIIITGYSGYIKKLYLKGFKFINSFYGFPLKPVCMHVCCLCTYIHTCMCRGIISYTHTRTQTNIRICVCVYIYIYIYIYICLCAVLGSLLFKSNALLITHYCNNKVTRYSYILLSL